MNAGFWQHGIHPYKPKTALCIPDHHFQWTVMPFGLKNDPSCFQKAMIQIFQPLLSNALIYIDNILPFSPNDSSHAQLLTNFHSLVQKYEVMLSEKKMIIAQSSIDFLGMTISNRQYQLQPHISQKLLKFPDELNYVKQV